MELFKRFDVKLSLKELERHSELPANSANLAKDKSKLAPLARLAADPNVSKREKGSILVMISSVTINERLKKIDSAQLKISQYYKPGTLANISSLTAESWRASDERLEGALTTSTEQVF